MKGNLKRMFMGGAVMFLITFGVMMLFNSYTENTRAKAWGGSMTINLEQNQKLVNVTWKDADLWILTRPMRAGEQNETYYFIEKSTFGVLEGRITFIESGGIDPTSYLTKPTSRDMDIPPREIIEFKLE